MSVGELESVLPNFEYAQVQKPIKMSKGSFIIRYFIMRLREEIIFWLKSDEKLGEVGF